MKNKDFYFRLGIIQNFLFVCIKSIDCLKSKQSILLMHIVDLVIIIKQ